MCYTPGVSIVSPVEIRAPEGALLLEIEWEDGLRTFHAHRVLRGYCPCALCQGHDGPVRWVPGSEALDSKALAIVEIEQAGSYAIRLSFGDGHSTGIYTFEFLRELGPLYEATGSVQEHEFGR